MNKELCIVNYRVSGVGYDKISLRELKRRITEDTEKTEDA